MSLPRTFALAVLLCAGAAGDAAAQTPTAREIPGDVRLTFSYDSSRGVHQRRTRNINAPYPGTPLPEDILNLGSAQRQDSTIC